MKLDPKQVESICGFLRLELGEDCQWMLFLDYGTPGERPTLYSGDVDSLEKGVIEWAKSKSK